MDEKSWVKLWWKGKGVGKRKKKKRKTRRWREEKKGLLFTDNPNYITFTADFSHSRVCNTFYCLFTDP